MQTNLQKIVSVASYPGLYKYLSQARLGIIVESLKDGKRSCVPHSAKISAMSDITIYTIEGDDLMLKDVFNKIKEKRNSEQILSHKSSPEELKAFFDEIVPEYNKEKVFVSHMRKMVEWYNILQGLDMLDFIDKEENTEETSGETETSGEETEKAENAEKESEENQ